MGVEVVESTSSYEFRDDGSVNIEYNSLTYNQSNCRCLPTDQNSRTRTVICGLLIIYLIVLIIVFTLIDIMIVIFAPDTFEGGGSKTVGVIILSTIGFPIIILTLLIGGYWILAECRDRIHRCVNV